MNDPVKEILRHLERISASGGQSNSNIFDDFLDISLATIESLPGHVKSAVKKETYIDTPETEKLFLDMHSRYTRSDQWDHFAAAFGILLSSTDDWRDVIGDTYMQFNVANKHTGQFFTPWDMYSPHAWGWTNAPRSHEKGAKQRSTRLIIITYLAGHRGS